MKIFIDNGHGQFTAGKRSPDGQLREAFFNREIARRIVLDLCIIQADPRAIITSKGLTYEELLSRPEEELEKFFVTKKPDEDNRQDRLEEAFSNADSELGKVGVTKFLLWNEYGMSNPDGYSYPQFCKLYRERAETVDVSMHMEHRPGDKLYIDYTGKKIPYVDRSTGEVKDAEIFVTAMGHSEYLYVEASPSQSQECFAECLCHSLSYYGGVPQVLVPDNLKSAVVKAPEPLGHRHHVGGVSWN